MKNKTLELEQPVLKDLGSFETEPQFAYLWDRCVYELHYDAPEYIVELCELFNQYGVDKKSNILDTCAGSGFPALDMFEQGYKNVVCVDGTDDQVELFNSKASANGLKIKSQKCSWQELSQHFSPEQFNALICRGSIWYAAGGWNKDFKPERETSLKAIKDTLATFYSLLAKGGILYIDKFQDNEVDHKDTVGVFEVVSKKKELMFWSTRNKETGIRRASMIVKDMETGIEEGLPNVTYNLKEEELEAILREVGFTVTKPEMTEEKFFTPWLAVKE
jgi:16S rRNA G966 N2-methylase RsmD